MHCLWCDEAMVPSINWQTLIKLAEPKQLCSTCENELAIMEGNRCVKCSRMSERDVCPDCEHWEMRWHPWEDPLACNISVFQYNEWIKGMVTRWKYRGDYCLGKAFQVYYHRTFKEHFSFLPRRTIVVPIPLSDERLRERGFNQAEMLAECLPGNLCQVLTRTHSEKQSQKTKVQRITGRNPFKLTKAINNPVILADDIYTTGATLRHAASLLKQSGCPAVYALTLIRG
ncbi:ComF family protein [Lentibacillus cibarius]|uniref:ComF family protein n=1 Tax=Lentibacillus cibarius TaxID=2583219 RepID=A0A549YMN2_9BACI|nr:ComF family protein [Lentibacillus cibarius]TMN23782.1 ComF family protein [Lentibacillus cibarius]TRM13136.1 ComF family protein [Lentibacillus cibarius]